jgi:carboxypeptidase Taq
VQDSATAVNIPPAYRKAEARFERLLKLGDATRVLEWDNSAMMPAGGVEARSEQVATLRVIHHEALTAPETDDVLGAAEAETPALDAWQRANLQEMRREWAHASAVPGDLVEAYSKACAICEMRWRTARPANDFKGLLPDLATVLALTRRVAEAKSARLGLNLYDSLLDEWEPGGRSAAIDVLFDDLARFLPGFIDDVLARQGRLPEPLALPGPFPTEKQRALATRLMARVGFDFDHGRLDTSAHPFCGGVPDDVRITTRWTEADFATGLMGVLHETGHAMYERGLPAAWRDQPVGRARGMSIHESQSLLVEMQASRSREFVAWLAGEAKAAFDGDGPAWSAENFTRIYHRVRRGLIRVDADEATYPCHVILRYRLERAMIAGELALADLPGAWSEQMKAMVGVVPPDDRDGCLQDIHWPSGTWAYFPTYTLGAMTAAQFFAAATKADPSIPAALGRGEFAPLMAWLRREVHGRAASLPTPELIKAATGRPLDAGFFEAHLKRRYLDA